MINLENNEYEALLIAAVRYIADRAATAGVEDVLRVLRFNIEKTSTTTLEIVLRNVMWAPRRMAMDGFGLSSETTARHKMWQEAREKIEAELAKRV